MGLPIFTEICSAYQQYIKRGKTEQVKIKFKALDSFFSFIPLSPTTVTSSRYMVKGLNQILIWKAFAFQSKLY